MLLWLSMLGLAEANDVLLPHITAVELDDFAIATEIEDMLVQNLEGLGLSVVGPRTLDQEYPELASSCFELEICPSVMLQRDASTLLLVGSVETTATQYNLQVRFYGRTSTSPLDVQTFQIPKDQLASTVEKISQDASVIFMMIPEEEAAPVKEVVVIEKQIEPSQEVVIIEKTIEAEFVQPPPTKVILSLPSKFEQDYYDSNLMPDEWLRTRRVRAKNVSLEMHAGLALLDVARSYDTRIGYKPDATSVFDIYEYDTFFPGYGAMLGGAIAHAFTWWLEIGIYGGVIIAPKKLSTGWEMQDSDGTVLQSDDFQQTVTSISGHIEPLKTRIYMLPSGPIKPYVMVAPYLRLYDEYIVPDAPTVDYGNQPGGLHYGVTTGGGLAFDSTGPVGVFLELPWTYVFNQTPYDRMTDPAYSNVQIEQFIKDTPERPGYTKQVMGVKMGMSLRF
jgi:hypothetical protein